MTREQARREVWGAVGAYMSADTIETFYPAYPSLSDADARRIEEAYDHVMRTCRSHAARGTGGARS